MAKSLRIAVAEMEFDLRESLVTRTSLDKEQRSEPLAAVNQFPIA